MASFDIKTIEAREKLPVREKPYWEYTEPNRHLGIRVRKTRIWVMRCRTVEGDYLQSVIGPAEPYRDGISYAEALKIANKWFADCRARKYSKSAHYLKYNGQLIICPIGPVFTVGHALKAYVDWKRLAASPTHFQTNVILINYHIVPRLAHIPVEEFNSEHLRKFCIDVLETPPKRGLQRVGPKRPIDSLTQEQLRKRKKTVNALISILRLAFELAWENGDIESERPRRCLRHLPNYDRPYLYFLSRDECRRLIDAAEPSLRSLILGALYSGRRISELRELQVKDVANQCHGVHIRRAKNYRSRHVLLPDEGMAFFLAQCDGKSPDAFVFLNRRGRRWGDLYRHLFKKTVIKAGLSKEIVFHSLRHTYASQLLQNGATLTVLARQLGHADVKTVHQIYGHLTSDSTLAELDRCFEGFGGIPKTEMRQRLKPLQELRKTATVSRSEDEPAWPQANFSRARGSLAGLGNPWI